jgi:CheY-like chemotaxis protein
MTIPTLQSVLCVDDDPDICAVLEAALSLVSGLSVHIADSGERAIDLAYELRPDLILMDVMMPGLDGPCTVRRMRERSLIGRIPVIFLTGKVMRTEVANFLDLGAIGVIGKPFDPLTLGTELASIWRHPHAGAFPRLAGEFAAGPNRPVDELTLRFRERLRRDVVVLRDLAVVAQQGEVRVLPDIERLSHTVHGSGALFGFPAVSALGGIIEQLCGEIIACLPTAAPGAMFVLLQQLRARSDQLLQSAEAAVGDARDETGMCNERPRLALQDRYGAAGGGPGTAQRGRTT